jgi:hypothetical protein
MKPLTLETFITKDNDFEINQYKILSALKEYLGEIRKNKLYPSLSNLVHLSAKIEKELNEHLFLSIPIQNVKNAYISDEKGSFVEVVDLKNRKSKYNYDLMEWTLAEIKLVLEEGYIVYDFIENNMKIEKIGDSQDDIDRGFFILRDNLANLLQVYRYEYSTSTNESRPFKYLKTDYLQSIKLNDSKLSLEDIKADLIKQHHEKSKITLLSCSTTLEFPYLETIFPVAKRKLITFLGG